MSPGPQPGVPRRESFGPLALAGGALALASCALGACADGGDAPRENAPLLEVAPGEPRGAILLSIDTLRADHLGCYGYERDSSPALDALAARGALFEQAVSSAPWTIPAHMSMLTGLYPRSHGVDVPGRVLSEATLTLAAHLSAQGFATSGIVNTALLGKYGFPQGFREYRVVPEADGHAGSAPAIVAQARQWLEEQRGRRFFLFLHVYDVHSDFDPGPAYRERFVRPYAGSVDGTTRQLRAYRLRRRAHAEWTPAEARHLIDLYDAEIRQLDDALAGFLSFLDDSGLARETLLVVTSDHGEEFLEHGDVLHGRTLHRELVHVPLVLAGPGVPRGARFGGEVSPVDLFPTFARLLGVSCPPGLDGIDLSAGWRDPAAWPRERAVFSEARSWLGQEEGDYRSAIRKGPWSLHHDRRTGSAQLFHLAEDPGERADASSRHPEMVRALASELESYLAGVRAQTEAEELSQEELEELNKLGYR